MEQSGEFGKFRLPRRKRFGRGDPPRLVADAQGVGELEPDVPVELRIVPEKGGRVIGEMAFQ